MRGLRSNCSAKAMVRAYVLLRHPSFILGVFIIIIIIVSFFKVDFYITFYNYKKSINVNLPIKLEKNPDAKRFAKSLL